MKQYINWAPNGHLAIAVLFKGCASQQLDVYLMRRQGRKSNIAMHPLTLFKRLVGGVR